MAPNYDMSDVNWKDVLLMLEEVIEATENGEREQAKTFLLTLADKKIANRRTWGRMSMLAQDILGKFDDSNDSHICEVLRALRAIVIVAMNEDK